jgi:hypothetical protein
MTDLSLMDMNIDDVQESRDLPPGGYVATVTNYKSDKIPNEKQTEYVDVEFRILEAVDGQDLAGVNLNRPVYGRIWASPAAAGAAKKELNKFGVDVTGLKFKDAFDKIVGATVRVQVGADKYFLDKRNEYRPIAKSWAAA